MSREDMSTPYNKDVPPMQQLDHFLSYDPQVEVKLRHRVGPNVLKRLNQISVAVSAEYPQLPFEVLYRKSTIGGYHHIKIVGHATAVNTILDRVSAEGWAPEMSVNMLPRTYFRKFDNRNSPAVVGVTGTMWSTHSPMVNLKQKPFPETKITSRFPTAEDAVAHREAKGILYDAEAAHTAALMNLAMKNLSEEVIEENANTLAGHEKHSQAKHHRKWRAIHQTQKRKHQKKGGARKTRRSK